VNTGASPKRTTPPTSGTALGAADTDALGAGAIADADGAADMLALGSGAGGGGTSGSGATSAEADSGGAADGTKAALADADAGADAATDALGGNLGSVSLALFAAWTRGFAGLAEAEAAGGAAEGAWARAIATPNGPPSSAMSTHESPNHAPPGRLDSHECTGDLTLIAESGTACRAASFFGLAQSLVCAFRAWVRKIPILQINLRIIAQTRAHQRVRGRTIGRGGETLSTRVAYAPS
jgi:hypothetical protein